MLALIPADIVLSRSRSGILGPVIHWFEQHPGDDAYFNHVGVITQSGVLPYSNAMHAPVITEALGHVRSGSIWDYYGPPEGKDRPEITIYRPCKLTSATRTRIAAAAEAYIGQDYAWWRLLLHAGDWWLSKQAGHEVRLLRRINLTNKPICSWLVAEAFASEGLSFGVPPASADPDDIDDYCRTRPQEFRCLFGPAVLGTDTLP